MTVFYKPSQGDSAAAVAEGYDRNFQQLEASKVDTADHAGLMTDTEREKLSGIEEGANAYTHPESHPADMITDTAEKVVMTTAERDKLAGIAPGANAYTLPPATAETLGGIKIGDGLEIAADGTLCTTTPAADTPSFSQVTPVEELTAADRLLGFDADGNPVTATAEQVAAYAHATAPTPVYRNLCMNSRGETLNCWDRGTSHGNISIDTEKFGYPVIKNTKGNRPEHRIAYMISSGEQGSDNYPEILGMNSRIGGKGLDKEITISYDLYPMFDCEVIYENTGAGEDVRIPVVGNRWNRVVATLPAGFTMDVVRLATLYVNGSTYLPLEIDTAWYLKNIQIEWGGEATPYTHNPTIPYSLEEQVVPGKFFPDHNSVLKQVYRKTFQFQTSTVPTTITLATGLGRLVDCSAIMNNCPVCYYYSDTGNTMMWSLAFSGTGVLSIQLRNIYQLDRPLFLTIDYVKR